MAVKPIPDGFHSVTPSLVARDAGKLITFMKDAFGAVETMRMPNKDGSIMHAEVKLGDSVIMLTDAVRDAPMPAALVLYVPDVDATYQQALKAGATSLMEPADMFWGDRFSRVKDGWGNDWGIATHVEDVPSEEMPARAKAAMGG